jgi:leucyl-tRNA synthetase
LATQEKKGVPTGLTVKHPLTGAAVEVWVGNYVLMSYGDGAVMGVPAHDERDFVFARKYGLAIQPVVAVEGEAFSTAVWADSYADKQRGHCVNSGPGFEFLDGLAFKPAVAKVAELLAEKGLGEKKTTWRLRDWGVSRQRYWGTPIPIIHCDGSDGPGGPTPGCGAVPVPDKDLPVVLPEDCIPDGSGNPLNKRADFLNVACPRCGKPARRETDTMDTFVDSSWYFMRYCDPSNAQAMVADGTNYWMPAAGSQTGGPGMDQYIGGIEHAILHLLYARFWTKVMRDLGLVSVSEPFTKLLTQGMVLNHIYSRRGATGGIDYFWPADVVDLRDESGKVTGARLKSDGTLVDYEGVGTMSKSKNNGVDPQALIDQYGADTARLFVMFASPPEQTLEWNDAGVEGAHRFLKRVWSFSARHAQALQQATGRNLSAAPLRAEAAALRREVHLVLRQVSHDYDRMQYNTVVSGCMKLLNALDAFKPDASDGDLAVLCEGTSVLLRALYPACPHITHALWSSLGFAGAVADLLDAPWPVVDEAALVQDEIELVLQISGKMRGAILVPAGADKAAIEAAALASPEFAKFSEGKPAKKVIVVPGRLVNVVV